MRSPARGDALASRRGPLTALVVAGVLLIASVAAAPWILGTPWGPREAVGPGRAGGLPGMMYGEAGRGHWSGGMMSGGMMSGGMMSGRVWSAGDGVAVTSIAGARARAAGAAASSGLHPGEIVQFTDNFYVELKDAAGASVTEALVDPAGGAVATEPGPAMMWNTRYGMMHATYGRNGNGYNGHGMMGGDGYDGGMMGGQGMMGGRGWGPPTGQATATVTADQARTIAQQWLAANRPGHSAGPPDTYPGYYTMETTTTGTITGMLSVNAGTGAVWYHTWHGRYLAKVDN